VLSCCISFLLSRKEVYNQGDQYTEKYTGGNRYGYTKVIFSEIDIAGQAAQGQFIGH
jgi:hypothetical protein